MKSLTKFIFAILSISRNLKVFDLNANAFLCMGFLFRMITSLKIMQIK